MTMKRLMNNLKTRGIAALMIGAAALALGACGPSETEQGPPPATIETVNEAKPAPVQAEGGDAKPAPALASPLASPLESPLVGDWKQGLAGIDRVTLRVDAATPQMLSARVKGYLGDACTQLGAVTQSREGNVIRVAVGTLRPADRMCAQVIKDFEVDVPIDVTGLSAGAHTVEVNGVSAQFEMDANGPKVP
jgi:hypothetical protein